MRDSINQRALALIATLINLVVFIRRGPIPSESWGTGRAFMAFKSVLTPVWLESEANVWVAARRPLRVEALANWAVFELPHVSAATRGDNSHV